LCQYRKSPQIGDGVLSASSGLLRVGLRIKSPPQRFFLFVKADYQMIYANETSDRDEQQDQEDDRRKTRGLLKAAYNHRYI